MYSHAMSGGCLVRCSSYGGGAILSARLRAPSRRDWALQRRFQSERLADVRKELISFDRHLKEDAFARLILLGAIEDAHGSDGIAKTVRELAEVDSNGLLWERSEEHTSELQ